MNPVELSVRDAVAGDIGAITAIYAHAVRTGTATFELEPPSREEMLQRFKALREGGFPYLVCTIGDEIAGYAYAGAYRKRPAYRFTVEDSVYVHPDWQGKGIGRALLEALIDASTDAGFRQMIAVIGDEDSAGSIALHEACGFAHAGTLKAVGHKFGEWRATVLMQRALGRGAYTPPGDR